MCLGERDDHYHNRKRCQFRTPQGYRTPKLLRTGRHNLSQNRIGWIKSKLAATTGHALQMELCSAKRSSAVEVFSSILLEKHFSVMCDLGEQDTALLGELVARCHELLQTLNQRDS